MSWGKIQEIFQNRNKIWEGLRNKIFKREHVEAVYEYRREICAACEYEDLEGHKCAVPGTQPCCAHCGCSLGIKLRSLSSECPIKKWTAVVNKLEEDMINEQIAKDTADKMNDSSIE